MGPGLLAHWFFLAGLGRCDPIKAWGSVVLLAFQGGELVRPESTVGPWAPWKLLASHM